MENTSRRLRISPISQEEGWVLASLSYYIALLGGRVFIDAGAGIGYSTLWILYGVSRASHRSGVYLYAVERNPDRYAYLQENIEKARTLLLRGGCQVEVRALNVDFVEFLENTELSVDMVFIDVDKKQYADVLELLPRRLSEIGIGVFHNATVPGLDERAKRLLEKQDQLVYHLIPTQLGLLIVKRTTKYLV